MCHTAVAVQEVGVSGAFQANPLDAHQAGSALSLIKCTGIAHKRAGAPCRAVSAWEDPHAQPCQSAGRRLPGNPARVRAAVAPDGPARRGQRPEVAEPAKQGAQACEQLCQQPSGTRRNGAAVAVIAPGAGTRANGAAYADLGRDAGVRLEIVGQSGGRYDRYPPSWPQGAQAPNLESFAQEVQSRGIVEQSDCLIFGSRGGQVVLPSLWRTKGAAVPPAIVINGGCAMNLPTSVFWPETAVTFLLLGGRDTFRGGLSPREYVDDARNRVPRENRTTAILYIPEMVHMPQAGLLGAALRHMLAAALAWRTSDRVAPLAEFERLAAALGRGGWGGQLWYTVGNGAWQDIPFGVCKAATDSLRLTAQKAATDSLRLTAPRLSLAKGGA